MLTDNFCVFCRENEEPSSALGFLPSPWPYASRIIYSNPGVYVIPGLGPQVYPYALIVTRYHLTSLADTTRAQRSSLLQALNALLTSNLFPSGELCVFEHGGCGNNTNGCVDHCHLHVIDGKYPLEQILAANAEDAIPICMSEEHPLPRFSHYLFAGCFKGGENLCGTLSPSKPLHRQYFRRILAKLTHTGDWNWRLRMNDDWLLRLADEAHQAMGCPALSEGGLTSTAETSIQE